MRNLSRSAPLTGGGTISGDLTIDGELTVSGTGAFAYTEVVTGDMAITNAYDTVGLTITQGGDNYALKIVQNDADKAALFIDAATTTSHLIYIDGVLTTTGSTIRLDGLAGLTTGAMFNANITSANLETGGSTGAFRIIHSANSTDKVSNIMHLHNDDAGSVGVVPLKIQQDSTGPALVAMGDVGIGTAAPTSELQVDAANGGGITIMGPNADNQGGVLDFKYGVSYWVGRIESFERSGGGGDLFFYSAPSASEPSTPTMVMLKNQNVGIGETNPGSLLDVKTTSAASYPLTIRGDIDNDGGYTGIRFGYNGSSTSYLKAAIHVEGTTSDAIPDMHFCLQDTADGSNAALSDAKLSILNNGNVGIGTAVPAKTLHVSASAVSGRVDNASVVAILERNGHAYLQISTPDGSTGGVVFGNNADSFRGGMTYNQNTEDLELRADGSTRLKIDPNSRISLSNNDAGAGGAGANTIFGKLAGAGVADGALYNVLIGEEAGNDLTVADHNVAIGYQAFDKVTTACDGNVAIGYQSMHGVVSDNADNCVFIGKNTCNAAIEVDASGSVGIGFEALKSIVSGAGAVAIGHSALTALTSGTGNTAIGYLSGKSLTTADNNTFVGQNTGEWLAHDTANGNVAVGFNAMGGGDESTTAGNTASYNIAIGGNAVGGTSTNTTTDLEGNNNVGIGWGSLATVFSASDNIAIGRDTGNVLTTGGDHILIGSSAGASIAAGQILTNGTVAIGKSALTALTSGAGNTAVGYQALMTEDTGPYSTAIGHSALKIQDNANGMNTAVGYNSQISTEGGSTNTSVGHLSMQLIGGSSANNNVAIGANSMKSSGTITDNVAANNVAVGPDSLLAITTGQRNVAIGSSAGDSLTTLSDTVLIGRMAGQALTTTGALQDGTVAVGMSALTALTSGAQNTAVGYTALDAENTGSYSTAVGYEALTAQTGGASTTKGNTAVGAMAGKGITGGQYNTAVGWGAADTHDTTGGTYLGQACGSNGTGDFCVFVGMGAGETGDNTQDGTIGIGYNALLNLTSGERNVAIGFQALEDITEADDNVALGHLALNGATNTGSNQNVAIGSYTLNSMGSNLSQKNTAVGHNALTAVTTGNENTAIGRGSGVAISSGSVNTCIGNDTGTTINTGSNNTLLGYGANVDEVATSNQTVIGCSGLFRFFSASVLCPLLGDTVNDPAHVTPIGKIPALSIIKRVTVTVTTLSNLSSAEFRIVTSSTASATDGTVLADVVEILGANVASTVNSAVATSGTSPDIIASSGGAVKQSYYAEPDYAFGSAARYVYVAMSKNNGETNSSSAIPIVNVMVEYIGTI